MKRSQRNMTWLSTEVQFYTKFSGLGRPLVIQLEYIGFIWKQALQYVELVLTDMKNVQRKMLNAQEECKNSKELQMSLSKKKWQSITQGKNFCAIPETKLSWFSYYHDIWKKMDTQLSTRRMMLILKLLKQLGALHLKKKKKMLLYLQKTQIYLHYFCILGTLAWEKPSRRQTKGRAKFKVGQYKKDCRETESCHR